MGIDPRLGNVSPADYMARGAKEERAKIVAWIRTFPLNEHARDWAEAIENREDDEDPAAGQERIRRASECVR